MKLTTRILILAGATLLPGVLAAAYNEYALRGERAVEVRPLAMRNTTQVGALIEQVLQSIRGILTTLATSDNLSDAERCSQLLASLKDNFEYLGGLGVIDPNGDLRCASGSRRTTNLADRDYFNETRKLRAFYTGEYVVGRISDRPQLMLGLPIAANDAEGTVLFASLDLNWLQKRLERTDLPLGGNITVADRNGTILARVPQPERFVGTKIPEAFLHLLHAEKPDTIELESQDGTRRYLAYAPLASEPVGFYVSSGLSRKEAFRLIDRSTFFTLAVTVGGTWLALLFALIVGRHFIARPAARILQMVEQRRGGADNIRTAFSEKDGELGMIGSHLDRLFDETQEKQRELLSRELAHRIKNTLAIVQAIASQTLRGDSGLDTFNLRIKALSHAYDVLLAGKWERAPIRQIIDAAVAPHQAEGGRIRSHGPNPFIDARA